MVPVASAVGAKVSVTWHEFPAETLAHESDPAEAVQPGGRPVSPEVMEKPVAVAPSLVVKVTVTARLPFRATEIGLAGETVATMVLPVAAAAVYGIVAVPVFAVP